MKIRTNKYNILESQMILLSEEDSELWLSIIVDNTNLGELHLCFESSEQIDNHNLKIEPEENGLKIIFKNFNNSNFALANTLNCKNICDFKCIK